MRKFLFVTLVALFATAVSASTFDVKAGYGKTEGVNGYQLGASYFVSLYKADTFVKDISVGLMADYNIYSSASTYSFLAAPAIKVVMPYSYAILGYGYDYTKGAAEERATAFVMELGLQAKLTDTVNGGLFYELVYKTTGDTFDKTYAQAFGPFLSFNL